MMAVDEIYDYLKDNKGFHSAKQIATALGIRTQAVNKSLKVVVTYKDIACKYVPLVRKHKGKRVGLKTKKAWVYAHKKRRK